MNRRLLALTLLALALSGCPPHATDEKLLSNFEKLEADFERLLSMLRTDRRLERIDTTWTRPKDPSSIGVTPERMRVYRELLSTLGLKRGFYAFHDPEHFTFLSSITGSTFCGSAKGYVYLDMAEKPEYAAYVVADLDRLQRKATWGPHSRTGFVGYRPIKGNWYIYFTAD